jgi:hypothetical protein
MTVLAIFSVLVVATVSSQLFGLRMYRLSASKLTLTANARGALNRIRDEVRSGKLLYVGNGDDSSFAFVPANTPHIGNSLKICATTDTNSYVRYYLDADDSCLKRIVSGSGQAEVVARYVTNELVFRAEDFQGNALTNYQNNRVINITLHFCQRAYPLTTVGTSGVYENYRLQTRIARRAIE